jgi:hypothetical protein
VSESRAISKVIACTTAGTHVLYTCPLNCRAKIPLVFITNANGTNTITFKWYRKVDDLSYYIIGGKNLSLGEFIQLSDAYIVLDPEDRLEVTLSSNGNVDALCTAEETFTPNTTRATTIG